MSADGDRPVISSRALIDKQVLTGLVDQTNAGRSLTRQLAKKVDTKFLNVDHGDLTSPSRQA